MTVSTSPPALAAFHLPTARRCRLKAQPATRKLTFDIRTKRSTGKHPHEMFMVENIAQDAVLSMDPSSLSTTTIPSLAGITPVQEFEPVMNMPAAVSFLIIVIVFTLLQLRISAVSNAAERRAQSLEALRKAESLQLSASDVGIDASDRPSSQAVANAKKEYEDALRSELNLRTVIPGVRIVAPNDPKRDEEERAAAKRFLGWGSDEFGDDESEIDNMDKSKRRRLNNGSANNQNNALDNDTVKGLSNGANTLLFGVGTMLILLLWTLSFDPMQADQVFTTLGGAPPSDMPFSSWYVDLE